MKNSIVFISLVSILLLSCESTKISGNPKSNEKTSAVVEIPVKTEAELYSESVEGITLSVVSKPSYATSGNSFKVPFTVKVSGSDGQGIKDFSVIVRYPVAKENNSIQFSETVLTTDENGIVNFNPEKTSFSCDSHIDFLPDAKSESKEVIKIAESMTVKAEYKVRTNLRSNGIIGLVDYNPKGTPLTDTLSSSLLLKNLMNKGFTGIGNFDIPRNIIDNKDSVYKHVRGMVGNSVSFLIYGTIKHVKPVYQEDGNYICELEGNIFCMDIKTGNILYSTVKQVSAKDASDWKAINSARVKMAEELGYAINFNM